MAKTLKQILEVEEPHAKGEKRFKAKHTIKKTEDAAGNDDKLFNASNIKTADYRKSPDIYEEANRDSYELHHGRAQKALATLSKHLDKHKKLTKGDRNHWDIKELSRSLEDMVHSASARNDWSDPTPLKTN